MKVINGPRLSPLPLLKIIYMLEICSFLSPALAFLLTTDESWPGLSTPCTPQSALASPCLGWDPRLMMCFCLNLQNRTLWGPPFATTLWAADLGEEGRQREAAHAEVPTMSKPPTHGSSTTYAAATSGPPVPRQ